MISSIRDPLIQWTQGFLKFNHSISKIRQIIYEIYWLYLEFIFSLSYGVALNQYKFYHFILSKIIFLNLLYVLICFVFIKLNSRSESGYFFGVLLVLNLLIRFRWFWLEWIIWKINWFVFIYILDIMVLIIRYFTLLI